MTSCRLLIFLLMVAVLAMACTANETDNQKPVIRLHDALSESQWINNAIAKFIIEEGYGYPVETVVESTPAMQEGLPMGTIDLNLEGWQQNIIDWYDTELEKGTIINLGMIYEGGPQYFIIPSRVAEASNIRRVEDMKEHWKLFQDPQDPTKGVFYNCISGWECAKINRVKLEAYGLGEYYNIVSPSSATALTAALENAQETNRPVFGYYWEPSTLAAAHPWHILEEPPYTLACWEQVIAAVESNGAQIVDQACAYENIPIEKLAHAGLREKAPEVFGMLALMVVGLDPLNKTMAWSEEHQVQDWEKAAVYYLENYDDRWRGWVTPDVYDKVKKALAEAAQGNP